MAYAFAMGDQGAAEYGPYFRKRSSTQTDHVADEMVRSGELWGKVAFGGGEPIVQAYVGELGNYIGVEFFTTAKPYPNGHPRHAEWRPNSPGVWVDGDFAKIRIRVTRNSQTGSL